uniref:c-Myc-binding protein n=1 Tax=Anopheles farauti TaxID=69004 RepID=A0A182QH43_9DIPT
MSNYKPIDPAKEEFRKYLDRNGIMDAITKVLVRCHIERPENALEYMVTSMAECHAPMKADLIAANMEIQRLKKELSALKLANETKAKSSNPTDPVAKKENEIDNTNGDNDATDGASADEPVVVKQEQADTDESTNEDKSKAAASAATGATAAAAVESIDVTSEVVNALKNETTEGKEPTNTNESK